MSLKNWPIASIFSASASLLYRLDLFTDEQAPNERLPADEHADFARVYAGTSAAILLCVCNGQQWVCVCSVNASLLPR
jgi:hypothetical protein